MTVANERMARIRSKLEQALNPNILEIMDESHLHIGHAGAKTGLGHFKIRVVSSHFNGVGVLRRHQMIYAALGDMMRTDIHALSIDASSTD